MGLSDVPSFPPKDHALPTLEWSYAQSVENSLTNASWTKAGLTPQPMEEEIVDTVELQVRAQIHAQS